jgi:glutamine amidotransferase
LIAIVDYGMGNLASIANMLRRVGVPAAVTGDPAAIAAADRLILPGVGAFDTGMRSLRERGLVEVLERRARADRVPLLGICLGLQLLARSSEEGSLPGLGWLDAEVVRFRGEGLKVPHVGWNTVRPARREGLFEGAGAEPRFYFVHAFHLRAGPGAEVLGTTVHGAPFPSAVGAGNLLGVQFHPEKSHRFGMALLRNFAMAGGPPC